MLKGRAKRKIKTGDFGMIDDLDFLIKAQKKCDHSRSKNFIVLVLGNVLFAKKDYVRVVVIRPFVSKELVETSIRYVERSMIKYDPVVKNSEYVSEYSLGLINKEIYRRHEILIND